jgi:NADH:ubiquinone oxidoreductase subunit 3 (subunit A)
MASTYLELAVFGAVALLVPVAMLVFSRLVRPSSKSSAVETRRRESAEASAGLGVPVMGEYAHYLVIFIAFAVLCAIIIVWSLASKWLDFVGNIRIGLLLAAGALLEIYVLALSRRKV